MSSNKASFARIWFFWSELEKYVALKKKIEIIIFSHEGPFPYSNSSKTTVIKKLCKSKGGVFSMTTLWIDEFLRIGMRHVICKGFFSMTTPLFKEIFRISWFLKRKTFYIIEVGNYKLYILWVCYKGMAFWGGDNFGKAFAEALVHMSYVHFLYELGNIHKWRLEKTVTASLFHSVLHSSSPFFVEKTTLQELLPS